MALNEVFCSAYYLEIVYEDKYNYSNTTLIDFLCDWMHFFVDNEENPMKASKVNNITRQMDYCKKVDTTNYA